MREMRAWRMHGEHEVHFLRMKMPLTLCRRGVHVANSGTRSLSHFSAGEMRNRSWIVASRSVTLPACEPNSETQGHALRYCFRPHVDVRVLHRGRGRDSPRRRPFRHTRRVGAAHRCAVERRQYDGDGRLHPEHHGRSGQPGTFYLAAGNNDGRNITWLGETVNLAAKLEKHNKAEAASACARASLIQLALAQDPQLVPDEFELRRSRQVAGVAETIDLSVWPS